MFITVLKEELVKLEQDPSADIDALSSLVFNQVDTVQFAQVSNILTELMLCVVTILHCR